MKIHKLAITLAFLFVFIAVNVSAQSRKVKNMPTYDYSKIHFGFILGLNQMHFTIKPVADLNYTMWDSVASNEINADSSLIYSIEHDPTMGFTVGIVSNLRISKYFDLRFIPSLTFGERNLEYRFLKYRDGVAEIVEVTKNIPSTFIELPVHLKYKSQRVNNFRAYVLGGANIRIDLASQANKAQSAAEVEIKLQRNDIYGEIGVGADFYFEWFKFGTEIKMSYGILDILEREQNIYTDGIDKFRSKIFQVSFTFE